MLPAAPIIGFHGARSFSFVQATPHKMRTKPVEATHARVGAPCNCCAARYAHPDYVTAAETVQRFERGTPRVLPLPKHLRLYLHLVAQIDGVRLLRRQACSRGLNQQPPDMAVAVRASGVPQGTECE